MKGWRDKLEKSLATVNESSQRLRQQVQQAVQQGPSGVAVFGAVGSTSGGGGLPAIAPAQQQPEQQHGAEQQQYLRLPVESAKRLRWFDRQDINMLMQVHLREKQELFEANNALRQVLRQRGLGDGALEAELAQINSQVDAMRLQEEGVNQVLVLAAQAELEHLKEALDSAHHELEHLRRQRLQAASSSTLQLPAPAAGGPSAGPSALQERPQQEQQQQQQQQMGERVSLQLDCSEDEVSISFTVVPEVKGADTLACSRSSSSGQGPPPMAAALAALVQAVGSSGGGCAGGANGGGLEPQLLQQAAAALSQLAAARGVVLPGLPSTSAAPGSGLPHDSQSPLPQLPTLSPAAAAGGAVAAVAAEAASLPGGVSWQEQCSSLQQQLGRMQAEVAQAQQDAAFTRDAAERKAQEMRSRFQEAQQRQGELLRMAQDSRLDAESRCEAAERKLQMAEERYSRLDSEVKDLKAELRKAQQDARQREAALAAAESRAAAAEAAAQRAKGAAEMDVKSLEVVSQQRARIAELEAVAAQHQRQLAAARQQQEALEGRLTSAEQAAARAAAEVQELEGVVQERDAIAVRLSMMEARLDDTRMQQGQAESYRTLAQQSEEKRARAEDELLTTARLAASLEARLAAAARENEELRLEVQAAAARVFEAQKSVSRLVQERWQAAGGDRTLWPLAAQEEIENVEARLSALHAALKEAQAQLAEAQAAAEAQRAGRAAAERSAAAAQDRAERQQREAEQRLQRLEAGASAASVQMAEFRSALAAVEQERDQLLAEKQERERAAREAAAAVAAARRRAGSGGLAAAEADAALAAGLMPSPGGLLSPSAGASNGGSRGALSPLPAVKQRDVLEPTDLLYLKNVMLKFIDAHISGRSQECDVLLPAVATLLRATPAEYHVLRAHIKAGGSWLPSLMGS